MTMISYGDIKVLYNSAVKVQLYKTSKVVKGQAVLNTKNTGPSNQSRKEGKDLARIGILE